MNNKIKKNIIIICCVIIIFEIIGLYILGRGCIFKFIYGIPCLTCGLTRAWISFIRGDISKAFYYHPLFILAPFLCIYMLEEFKGKLGGEYKKIINIIFYICVALFIIVYIIRLVIIKEDIIYIDFENSLIAKIIINLNRK